MKQCDPLTSATLLLMANLGGGDEMMCAAVHVRRGGLRAETVGGASKRYAERGSNDGP